LPEKARVSIMMLRGMIPSVAIILILTLILPVQAHVPVSTMGNSTIEGAVVVDIPEKTYVFYGLLHGASDIDYYQLEMAAGDRLSVSLMNAGMDAPVPDLIILSPGQTSSDGIPSEVDVPEGYGAEIIQGQKPHSGEYEPFSPAAIFPVANYSHRITMPGTYYVAVVSRNGDCAYSIATGYREEFQPAEWVMVPISVISIHTWEGQNIVSILAPFFAVTIIGFVLVMRRESRKGIRHQPAFWPAIVAGLCFLGGSAVTLVQMVRALGITGFSPGIVITLAFALIPVLLSIAALRLARLPEPWPLKIRIAFIVLGALGILFWAGFLIGPVFALIAAVVPDR
jgi:hypothetical protein